jgi:hypothetical protein
MLSSALLSVEFRTKIEGIPQQIRTKFQQQVSSYQKQHSSESGAINITSDLS